MSVSLSNCPHCNKVIEKESIPFNKVYRNEAKIDVFKCTHCDEQFKIDPAEYLEAKKKGSKVQLYKSSELLKSERKAGFKSVDETIPEYDWDSNLDKIAEQRGINHKSVDDSMFDWSGYPIKVAIGLALFAVIFFMSE